MGSVAPNRFRDEQRVRQARWRERCGLAAGTWRPPRAGSSPIPLPWVLELPDAANNLWPPIAGQLLSAFDAESIAWHEEDSAGYGERAGPGPSPNLMDSQLACLNFWVGLAAVGPGALVSALRLLVPEAQRVVEPRAGTGTLVEPEWIGERNYLGERGRDRRRGKLATSADALLAVEDAVGRRVGVLLESKFSESYSDRSLRYSRRRTDRVGIYGPEWGRADAPFGPQAPGLHELMVDPFDQLMRLHLLARAMERSGELGFDRVLVAWAAPRANEVIWSNVTAPALEGRDQTVPEVWRSTLADPDTFRVAAYEDLFEAGRGAPGAGEWAAWHEARYGWSSM